MVNTLHRLTLAPLNDADAELADLVRPATWRNPTAAEKYDLVVLGGGTAGLVSAIGAAGLGARVALIERHMLGGDCLNTGCVPSKALIRSARLVGEIKRAASLGVTPPGAWSVDFQAVMNRMRQRRAAIAVHDSAARVRDAGVDVFFGDASFADDRTVTVDGQELRFRKAVIATGGRPTAPPVAGLDEAPYLTNETVFSLTELPRRLLVIGAGPIGCELAQAFARFGSSVTVLDQAPQVLPRESHAAAEIVKRRMASDGVRFELGIRLDRVDTSSGELRVHYVRNSDGQFSANVIGDALLVAAGRAPNIEGLNLKGAGIAASKQGVTVNDRLQTTNPRVYASGDVCSAYKFTHAADAMSRIVIQNALFFGRRRASTLVIPWVTYTDPEVAHVGVGEVDIGKADGRLQTVTVPLSEIDRAIVDDETDGFVEVHHERGRLRGCTIVAPHAGELIGEAVYAITHRGTLAGLSSTIHPYPTQAEALRKAGDLYRRQSLTPALRGWLERYFNWTR